MKMRLTLAIALLVMALISAGTIQAVNYQGDGSGSGVFYQGSVFRIGVAGIITGYTPREFADYLWDYHQNDMIARGWASTSDLPPAGVPYSQYRGTPYTVYQAIFNNTVLAANLSESYLWGVGCMNEGAGTFCLGADAGGYGVVPAGHFWRVDDVEGIFSALAVDGYTQLEIIMAGLYAGFDQGLVMQALVRANSLTPIHYSSKGLGDVDPAIYGLHPYIMTYTQPIWALITTGPPDDLQVSDGTLQPHNFTVNGTPVNPNFGKLVYGEDTITDCGPTGSGSAQCWQGEKPSYFVVPTDVVQQVGVDKLAFIGATTRRLIMGGAIVQDQSVQVGQDDNNYCRAPGLNDAGCLTLDQYSQYYEDMQALQKAIISWESKQQVTLIWGGVPLESSIPYFASQSQVITPWDAMLTESFHVANYMQSPGNISSLLDTTGVRYVLLEPDPKTYAAYLYQWLQYFSFTRDFTRECALLLQDYPSLIQQDGCEATNDLQAFKTFIVDQGVATSDQVTQAIQKGEGYMDAFGEYPLANTLTALANHIEYLWSGCPSDGLCTNDLGPQTPSQGQTQSGTDLEYLATASYDEFLNAVRTNNPVSVQPNFQSPFFYKVLATYSRFLFQFPAYWTQFQTALKTCLSGTCESLSSTTAESWTKPASTTSSSSDTQVSSSFSFGAASLSLDQASPQDAKVPQVMLQTETETTVTVTKTVSLPANSTTSQNVTGPVPQQNAIRVAPPPSDGGQISQFGGYAGVAAISLLVFGEVLRASSTHKKRRDSMPLRDMAVYAREIPPGAINQLNTEIEQVTEKLP